MEFSEKLQDLRKKKGLTQEELAGRLYVSRTAISKWESGRGYPNIDSLKDIAKFFSVTIDELLSSDEVLTIAQEEQKEKEKNARGVLFGLLDIGALLLLFLPLFSMKVGEEVRAVSLLSLTEAQPYVKVAYWLTMIGTILFGVLTLAMQAVRAKYWVKSQGAISLSLSMLALLLCIVTSQPYASAFAFAILAIKVFCLLKRS